MASPAFDSHDMQDGKLPPWEIAKAIAYHTVLHDISANWNCPCHELIGKRVDDYIAERVFLKGGGHPTGRSVRKLVLKCSDTAWFPGKAPERTGGRPLLYSKHQKAEVARVAMELKRKRVAPCPRRVRARLPSVARNPETLKPMSNKAIRGIFKTLCFDTHEGDPWQWLPSPAQDYLPESLKPLRVACAKHILTNIAPGAWHNHVAIDPCSSLLPKTAQRLEDQQVAAMGSHKWMSAEASRVSANLRAPCTAKKQGGRNVLQVHWTPVLTRGKIHIYICDADAASRDATLPFKLHDSHNLGKFIRNVLPGILGDMKSKYRWANLPRTIVHDKASYMATTHHDRLQVAFGSALSETGFTSWVGDSSASCKWLLARWGDVYLQETAISHIRRLLDTEFPCTRLHETAKQFEKRMRIVQDHMNSKSFSARSGGLSSLVRHMHQRCKEVVRRKGERLPK